MRGSQNYNLGSRTTAYSHRKCRSGTYTYQSRHKQKVYITGTYGLSIKGSGGTIAINGGSRLQPVPSTPSINWRMTIVAPSSRTRRAVVIRDRIGEE